ncbi:MAG TPA: hypothetical protein VG167_18880 [Verrucomicrobiae bacterium]|nr:hypothetical protein [Verrucomicrobiae bacterium]
MRRVKPEPVSEEDFARISAEARATGHYLQAFEPVGARWRIIRILPLPAPKPTQLDLPMPVIKARNRTERAAWFDRMRAAADSNPPRVADS